MVILSDPNLNNCLPLSLTYLQSVSQSVTESVRDWRSGVIVTWTIKWCYVLDLLFELVYLRTFSQGEIGSNVWKTIFLILDIKSKKKVQIVECVREEKSGGGLRHQIYRRCTSVWCTCIYSCPPAYSQKVIFAHSRPPENSQHFRSLAYSQHDIFVYSPNIICWICWKSES